VWLQVAERFGAILQQYLLNCGDHRTELGHQMFVMAKLEDIAMKVRVAACAHRHHHALHLPRCRGYARR